MTTLAPPTAIKDNTESAVVRLYGEPVLALPADLYIPPDALEIFLESFEGPLDLLLYLIRKANIDILDIPMATLTSQYLRYVDSMQTGRFELAAEYLLMAAMLLDIKSRMLLPRPPAADSEESAEDPRAELVRRLAEYEQMRQAAQRLDELPRAGRDYHWAGVQIADKIVQIQPAVNLHDLQLAWLRIVRQADLNRSHTVAREALSVREHMTLIMRRLSDEKFVAFTDLLEDADGRAELIVRFLALLELTREHIVDLLQNAPAAPIYIRRKNAVQHHCA